MIIRFTPQAEADLTKARRWYSHQRQDLDLEFMQCVDEAPVRVLNNPYMFPVVYKNLRRVVIHRFPFALFYEVAADAIEVTAVFHSRRDPDVWQSRV